MISSMSAPSTLELDGPGYPTALRGLCEPEHEDLFHTIADRGCLVSEFPPGAPPLKYHFPQRNRIIAGLARAVLVVEAPEKSGALNTAQHALEGGKEVLAVPGPIHNPTSAGTNRLIQDGAALVTSVADILHILESRTGEPLPEALQAGLGRDRLDEPLRDCRSCPRGCGAPSVKPWRRMNPRTTSRRTGKVPRPSDDGPNDPCEQSFPDTPLETQS